MVRAEADGTDSSASVPPADRAAVSSRRRATTSRRSNASSVMGRGSLGGTGRPADDRLLERGARCGRCGAQRGHVEGHGPPGDDRQPRLAEDRLDERASPALGEPTARQEELDDTGPLGRAVAGQELEQRPVQRQRDPGTVARFAVRAERAAMAERRQPGQGQRQDPLARPSAGVRDEPDPARVMLEPRVVQRGRAALLSGPGVAGSRLCSGEGTSRPPSIGVDGRPAEAFVTWAAERPGRHT